MARALVLVNGLPGAGKTTLAARLGIELGWPVVSKDAVKEAIWAATGRALPPRVVGRVASGLIWDLAVGIEDVVILDSYWFLPRDLEYVVAGVRTAGASRIVEVWCQVPPALARQRYAARTRDSVHEDSERLAEWDDWAARAGPLRVGDVVTVSTDRGVDVRVLARRLIDSTGGGWPEVHRH